MHSNTVARPQHTLFIELARQLAREGWAPGAPLRIRSATRAIDRFLCRQLVCGHCRRKGLEYYPYHRDGEYKVLAVCHVCQGAEEM